MFNTIVQNRNTIMVCCFKINNVISYYTHLYVKYSISKKLRTVYDWLGVYIFKQSAL